MKTIELTRGYVAMVDDEDYDRINLMMSWQVKKAPYTNYASGSLWKKVNGKWVSSYLVMHRAIMKPGKNEFIDHIDGNGLNNQKSNLRICTKSQNNMNCGPRSGRMYKGVFDYSYLCKRNPWAAKIRVNTKEIYLGLFKTEKEAALAYNRAAKKHHGEFAYLNKV